MALAPHLISETVESITLPGGQIIPAGTPVITAATRKATPKAWIRFDFRRDADGWFGVEEKSSDTREGASRLAHGRSGVVETAALVWSSITARRADAEWWSR